VEYAPLALALERIVECRLYQDRLFARPVLDIGCGEGLFAHLLFEYKVDTGIDPNSRELERAKKLDSYDELIKCFGSSIPKPDGFYKTIFSNSVLEHIEDIDPVFSEAFRVLAPGGYFYFTAPSERFERYTFTAILLHTLGLNRLEKAWRTFFNRFWVHYHCYSPRGWAECGQRAGFEVAEAFSYNPKRACLLNTFLTPLGLPAMICKKITNKWILFPVLRKLYIPLVALLLRSILRGAEKSDEGGLVFVALRKPYE